jgi:replication initiation protein RepC
LEARQHQLDAERQVTRKELSMAGRDAMRGLNLRANDRLLLGELIGCWGERMVNDRIMVHPSNEYLVARTGLSERQVRYGMRRLVEEKLVIPKDSANGKRFVVKNRAGSIVDVYGFDLTPVFARRGEWFTLVAAQEAQREARARLFDEVTICRRAIEEVVSALARLSNERFQVDLDLEELAARTPRRNLTVHEGVLALLVDAWRSLREVAEETYYQAASGGKLCPHIESKPPGLLDKTLEQEASNEAGGVEEPSPIASNAPVELVVEACPSLLEFVERPRTEVDLVAAGRYLRSSLGASGDVWDEACKALGPVNAAAAVCLVFQLYNDDVSSEEPKIRNPGGYLRAMVRTFKDGRSNVRRELMTMIRKRERQ